MKKRIIKLISLLLMLVLVIGCSNQNIDETENTNDESITSEENVDDQLVSLDSTENDEMYYYICPIIMDLNTGELKDVDALGLSEWMNIAILSTNSPIESEENLKDINSYFHLVDFRNVPYGTPETDFDDYVIVYELMRDNDWYVWYYYTSDFEKTGLAAYEYDLIYDAGDEYIEFTIKINNIEYYFRTNVYYTESQLAQYN